MATHGFYIRSPPSAQYAQTFHSGGYASARVHPHSGHQRHHSDPLSYPRHHSGPPPPHYAHDHRHRQYPVQLAPPPFAAQAQMQVPVQMHYHSQSRARRPSTGHGPRVADIHINPGFAYPSHSEPRYTHTKSILRNKGGQPSAPIRTPPHERRSWFGGLSRQYPAQTKQVQFRSKAFVQTFRR